MINHTETKYTFRFITPFLFFYFFIFTQTETSSLYIYTLPLYLYHHFMTPTIYPVNLIVATYICRLLQLLRLLRLSPKQL